MGLILVVSGSVGIHQVFIGFGVWGVKREAGPPDHHDDTVDSDQ